MYTIVYYGHKVSDFGRQFMHDSLEFVMYGLNQGLNTSCTAVETVITTTKNGDVLVKRH